MCLQVGFSVLFFFFFFFFFLGGEGGGGFSSVYVICSNMPIVTCYMFVYMYVHALMPPV